MTEEPTKRGRATFCSEMETMEGTCRKMTSGGTPEDVQRKEGRRSGRILEGMCHNLGRRSW